MPENQYNTSIVIKYGDIDNVQRDVKTLNDIIDRQGMSLLVDVLAERIGQRCIKFKLPEAGRDYLRDQLLCELNDAINERI